MGIIYLFVTAENMQSKITPASTMMTEDYLKKLLSKSNGAKAFNPNANPL